MNNILHINYSSSGGAGKVAKILANSQNELINYHSKFLYKINGDLWDNPFKDFSTSIKGSIDNYIVKNRSFKPMFTLTRESDERFFLKQARDHKGIIHLHWINGILTLKSLLQDDFYEKRTVLTMHDMVSFTGGCHHSLSCEKYVGFCEECPAVKKMFRNSVIKNKINKNEFLEKKQNIALVVPSIWLFKRIKDTIPLPLNNITIINNPVEEPFFEIKQKKDIRDKLKLPRDAFIIGFVSQNLDNPLKNFHLLIKILNQIVLHSSVKVIILAIGDSKNKDVKKNPRIVVTGSLAHSTDLVDNYAAVDVMVSTSSAETFGLSIAEAAALGTPSIVFRGTATEEFVDNLVTGFVVKTEKEFITNIFKLIESKELTQTLGERAKVLANSRFRVRKIVDQYDQVYKSLGS